jgi:hypothetical protein
MTFGERDKINIGFVQRMESFASLTKGVFRLTQSRKRTTSRLKVFPSKMCVVQSLQPESVISLTGPLTVTA